MLRTFSMDPGLRRDDIGVVARAVAYRLPTVAMAAA